MREGRPATESGRASHRNLPSEREAQKQTLSCQVRKGPRWRHFPALSWNLPPSQSCLFLPPSSVLSPLKRQDQDCHGHHQAEASPSPGPAEQGLNKSLWNQQMLPAGLAPSTQATQVHPLWGPQCPAPLSSTPKPPIQPQAHSSAMSSLGLESPGEQGQRPLARWAARELRPVFAKGAICQSLSLHQQVLFPVVSQSADSTVVRGGPTDTGCRHYPIIPGAEILDTSRPFSDPSHL